MADAFHYCVCSCNFPLNLVEVFIKVICTSQGVEVETWSGLQSLGITVCVVFTFYFLFLFLRLKVTELFFVLLTLYFIDLCLISIHIHFYTVTHIYSHTLIY